MNLLLKNFLFILCCAISAGSCAQSKKVSSGVHYLKITNSEFQRTLPGRAEGRIDTSYYMKGIWLGKSIPSMFYLKTATAWLPCRIISPSGLNNLSSSLKKGDEFILTAGGSDTISPLIAINKKITTAIIFKINKNWYYLPVNNFNKKQDVVMP